MNSLYSNNRADCLYAVAESLSAEITAWVFPSLAESQQCCTH